MSKAVVVDCLLDWSNSKEQDVLEEQDGEEALKLLQRKVICDSIDNPYAKEENQFNPALQFEVNKCFGEATMLCMVKDLTETN